MPRNKYPEDKRNTPFASTLRKLMDTKRITQEDLAKITGKTRQTISQYTNGISEPGYETLVKIADYFNVSIDYLLGVNPHPDKLPCAADDLGLSVAAISNIRYYSNPERSKAMEEYVKPDDCLAGLSLLLEDGFIFSLAGEIKRFCDIVNHRIELSKAFQDSTSQDSGEDYYKYRHSAEEDLLTRSFRHTLESQYPEFQSNFEILVGRHLVEHKRRIIIDDFEEILRKVSNYETFKNGIFP